MTQRERRLRKQKGESPGSGRVQLSPTHLGGNHFLRSREGHRREDLLPLPEHFRTCQPPSSRAPKGETARSAEYPSQENTAQWKKVKNNLCSSDFPSEPPLTFQRPRMNVLVRLL